MSTSPRDNPLGYQGVPSRNPPAIWFRSRDPNTTTFTDWRNYNIGDLWQNTISKQFWILVSTPTNQGIWEQFTGNTAPLLQFIAGNDAINVPPNVSGVINVVGDGTVITTTGNAATSTETIAITGVVPVPHGGTGAATLTGVVIGNGTAALTGNPITQHDVLVGGASNAITSIANGTDGQVFLAATGSDPAFASLTSTGNTITFTSGAHSLNLEAVAGTVTINQILVTVGMSPYSYSPSAGTTSVFVEVVGGGGAGGGAGGGGGTLIAGTGGGAGEYASINLAPSAQTVTIGAAGVGVNGGTGGSGGTTSFGALLTAIGGTGGINVLTTGSGFANGGSGGTGGTGGGFRVDGQNGQSGSYTAGGFVYPGTGGSTQLGAGANFNYASPTSTPVNGVAGFGFGSGGSGSLGDNGTTSTGGNGAPGLCIITEFIT